MWPSALLAAAFLVVWVAYLGARYRWRWRILLGASYALYAWGEPAYAPVLAATTIFTYLVGLRLDAEGPRRRALLGLGVGTLVLVLVAFKQLGPLVAWAQGRPYASAWTLPLGLSFFTFHLIAYLVDVYTRRTRAEEHLGIFALYVAFFPKLLSGPIERAERFIPQLRQKHRFDYARTVDGLLLMVSGVLKKLVLAAGLLPIALRVQGDPRAYGGASLVLAALAARYALFCDFSGYVDLARGAAQVLGFQLSENFHRPFFARSILAFWRRWHITFYLWLRDYLFLPLSRFLPGPHRVSVSVVIVFYLASLWHGASASYLLWATLQLAAIGIGLATAPARQRLAQRLGLQERPRLHAALQIATTFSILCAIDLAVQMRTPANAWYAWTRILSWDGGWLRPTELLGLLELEHDWGALPAIAGVVVMELLHAVQARGPLRPRLRALPAWARWALYLGALLAFVLFGRLETPGFYYLQF